MQMMLMEDTKILDLSQYVLGHYATQIMAEQGAEIIKIEQPPRPGLSGMRTSYEREFINNSNKVSLGLNLKTSEGREIFYRLTETAVVVFEGFRPGVVKRLGIDYETLRKLNPTIVYASLSGYGQNGAYRDLVGHDINYVAVSGILSMLPGMPPLNLLADIAGGSLFSVIGILMALLSRERTGVGQYVDIAMLDGVISMASWFTRITEQEIAEYNGTPYCNMYKTKDNKYITIGCIEPHFWENLCRAVNREDLIPYQLDESRRDEIIGILQDIFRTRTRYEWFDYLIDKDLCVAPVLTPNEMFSNKHVISRGMAIDVENSALGRDKQTGPALKFSNANPQTWQPAPRRGENTNDILTGLNYTTEEIERLHQIGAVS